MFQKVTLVGNLGADPELRYTNSGTAVANMRIATNEYFTKDGQKQEHTEWHRIVVWGKTAENCGQYLNKGRQVLIEGRLRTRQWEDRDGVKRYTTEVVANQVKFLGGRNQTANSGVSADANEVPTADVDPSVSQEAQELLQEF